MLSAVHQALGEHVVELAASERELLLKRAQALSEKDGQDGQAQ